jgi:hypothetical protein
MTERTITDMVEILRGSGNKNPGDKTPQLIGKIINTHPLALQVEGVMVTKNIYVNPSCICQRDMNLDALFENITTLPPKLIDFLKEFFNHYTIQTGDTVIIFRSGNSFYIAEKVVKAV